MRTVKNDELSLSTSAFGDSQILEALESRVLLSVTIDYNTLPVGMDPTSIAVEDFTMDGYDDIVTANEDGSSFSLLVNQRDGTFADAVTADLPDRPAAVFAEWINDDQLPDLGFYFDDTDTVAIYINMGDGTFVEQATMLVGDGATGFEVEDIYGDGSTAIVVIYDYGLLTVFHPDVNPFEDPGSSPSGGEAPPDGASLREFMAYEDYELGSRLENLVVADFTGDGIADFGASDPLTGLVYIMVSNVASDGTIEYEAPVTFDVGPVPSFLEAADVDGDRDLDLLVTSEAYDTLAVLINTGDWLADPVFYDTGAGPVLILINDLNRDGVDDVFVANEDSGTITVFSAGGGEPFGVVAELVAGDGIVDIVEGDFNNDGQFELVTANADDNSVTIMSFVFDPNAPDMDVSIPMTPDLLPDSDTGDSNTDDQTALNNGPASVLSFQIDGVEPGALVHLWADGYIIGSATVGDAATSVIVMTDGLHVLTEGYHGFAATQVIDGVMSHPSDFLLVEVDLPEVEDDSDFQVTENDAGETILTIESDDGMSGPLDINLTLIVDAPTIIGAIIAANEPKAEDETYAAGQTDEGFVLFSGSSVGEWEARNLTTEIPDAEPITSNVMKSYITPWGLVNFVGFNEQGDLLVYWQNGELTNAGEQEWVFDNLYDTQIRADGQETPNFNGDISVYITEWGGLNITGIDQNGDLQVVWWSPEEGWWRATNLTAELGGESLLGSVDSDVDLPDTIRLFGTTETGALVMYEWNPTDEWILTEITALTSEGDLATGSVSGFIDTTGIITAAAISDTGTEAVVFWLTAGNDTWQVGRIAVAGGDLLIGHLNAFENADGTLSIHGKTLADSPFELSYDVSGDAWNLVV